MFLNLEFFVSKIFFCPIFEDFSGYAHQKIEIQKSIWIFETNIAFLLETHSIKWQVKKLEFGLLSVIQFRLKSAMRNKLVF